MNNQVNLGVDVKEVEITGIWNFFWFPSGLEFWQLKSRRMTTLNYIELIIMPVTLPSIIIGHQQSLFLHIFQFAANHVEFEIFFNKFLIKWAKSAFNRICLVYLVCQWRKCLKRSLWLDSYTTRLLELSPLDTAITGWIKRNSQL